MINILLKEVKRLVYIKIKHYLCTKINYKPINIRVMSKTTKSAKSAKAETKRVNNHAAKAETTQKQVKTMEAAKVETATADNAQAVQVACLPAVVEQKAANKVEANKVLKSANVIKSLVKAERRGANVTIRLIAEQAANGDTNAINVMCALCDVPREALFTLNIDIIRKAVNEWYPYYVEIEDRRMSVKARGVWYSTACANEEIEEAAKRVTRGYVVATVEDYLEQLITAAKCRAKGIKPRRVDVEAVYTNNKLCEAVDGVTAKDLSDAKARKAYAHNAVNVWRKIMDNFWI